MAQKKSAGKKKGRDTTSERRSDAEDKKVNHELSGEDTVVTRRYSTRRVGTVAQKVKGETSGTRKSGSAVGVRTAKGKNDAKRKSMAEEEDSEMVKTPTKRRTTDQKKADASVSSSTRSSYNFRTKRAIPCFRCVDLSESGFGKVVGKRVKVFSSGPRKWYTGRIDSYDKKKKCHKVVCDNGDIQELDMKTQRFELEVRPGEAYNSKNGPDAGQTNLDSAHCVKKGSHTASNSTSSMKVGTRLAKKRDTELQKSKDTASEKVKAPAHDKKVSSEESLDQMLIPMKDTDMVISDIVEGVSDKVDAKNTQSNVEENKTSSVPSTRLSRSQKRKDIITGSETKEKAGFAEPVEKIIKLREPTVTKAAVSDAQTLSSKTKKTEGQTNVESRKNPDRKGRANDKSRN